MGQLGRYLHDYTAANGQREHAQQQKTQRASKTSNAERQQQPPLSLANLSLSDMTPYGVTITNYSKNTVKEITFEVTMNDCLPGYSPTTATSANQCTVTGQESKRVELFIPPGQTRGFRSQVNFHDVPVPPQGQRFFSWRIVSAKGMDAQ